MNPELDKLIDLMYESYLAVKGRQGNKRKYPSREEYGDIIRHSQIYMIALKEKQNQ